MELSGTIKSIIFRNEKNGWTVMELLPESGLQLSLQVSNNLIVDAQRAVCAVGTLALCSTGERIVLQGDWVNHREYGKQFKFTSAQSFLPGTTIGIERYLGSGLIKGVGPATAKNIVRAFGEQTFEILEKDWERLSELKGINLTRAQHIAQSFAQQVGLREIMIALQEYGITTNQAIALFKIYGHNSINIIKQNPYKMIDDVPGIGFKTADIIAQNMGFAHDSEYRIASGIKYSLECEKNDSGHTCLPKTLLIQISARRLDCSTEQVEECLDSPIFNGELISKRLDLDSNIPDNIGDNIDGNMDNHSENPMNNVGNQTIMIFLPYLYFYESSCAKFINEINAKPSNIYDIALEHQLAALEQSEKIALDDQQRNAVLTAFKNGALVITGGPGTGKTTITNFILSLMDKLGLDYEICAPTGRAAKRLSEATRREARTIHRMLEYTGEKFMIDGDNQLETDAIIVDETSMVDISLLYHLLCAVKPGTRLIFAGDVDQLPSVGAGNVLSDLISSHILPVVMLTQIFRQAEKSTIIINAHRINHGEMPLLELTDDFAFAEQANPESVLNTLLGIVSRGKLGDPWYDLQILSPTKKGLLGVKNLNEQLQARLNPKSHEKIEKQIGDIVFRVGDKVMQTRNNYQLEWERPSMAGIERGIGVFNGDIGTIMAIYPHDKIAEVLFDDARTALYDFELLQELDLAYCISVHKSQGSEFPKIILPIYSGPPMLMTRNLLYTAVTRASIHVVILGRRKAIFDMVNNSQERERFSALRNFLISTAILYRNQPNNPIAIEENNRKKKARKNRVLPERKTQE